MAPALAIIGGGNMAGAILRGLARASAAAGLGLGGIVVAEPDAERRRGVGEIRDAAGGSVATVASAAEALAWLREREGTRGEGWVMLAVKPQMLGGVAAELRGAGGGDGGGVAGRVMISILAGATTARIRAELPGTRVVRVMPNLAASVGEGCTAVALGEGATEGDAALAEGIFSAVGPVVVRIDEGMMDAFTAVAGSGPAYLFLLAEAMVRGAQSLGFDGAAAERVVRQTLRGAAGVLAASGGSPTALREAVTSKGGTTEAAIGVLAARGVPGAVEEALRAARDRGRELAG